MTNKPICPGTPEPAIWEGLNPPYRTIVADPPWPVVRSFGGANWRSGERQRRTLDYSTMTVDEVCALPVVDLAATAAHLYLWTTQGFLLDAFRVVVAWGFKPSCALVWCKPHGGFVGGTFFSNVEFVLFCRRGSLAANERVNGQWFDWPRGPHSKKPAAFYDLVERVSPGPYVDLFCRDPRFGWDSWGYGYESVVS